jgi:wobble nucleotide-excising tRNase
MITKISMSDVNSYKNSPATLATDKKVNLIYGLNGTGKTTLSDYLYDRTNPRFAKCSIEGITNEDILVYNQRFIAEYFYEPDNLKGIFTLSKENREAEEKVRNAAKEIARLELEGKSKSDSIKLHDSNLEQKKLKAENKTWEIKTKFTGGDRVLEYCLVGLMGKKESLFSFLSDIAKPDSQPVKTIDILKKEIDSIQGSTAQKFPLLPKINFSAHLTESNQLLKKIIIGNENSTVANLIKKLGNSDWVKKGLEYIPGEVEDTVEQCPFCQGNTITRTLIENIRNYFDKTYEGDISDLKGLLLNYEAAIVSITNRDTYEANPFINEKKAEFTNLYNAMAQFFSNNLVRISEKLKTPSQEISLSDSKPVINDFNNFIDDINKIITEHNNKIDNKDATLYSIKNQFWSIMRWDYDQTISAYQADKVNIEKAKKDLNGEILGIDGKLAIQKKIIIEQQKKTVNIEEAIGNINNGLLELGIDSFHIEKYNDILYKIVRTEKCDNTFQTLSEGEKMIISFLYFRELCKGKKTASSPSNNKIIVIDDPISSLSHIYIFNVGQMIKNDFFNSESYEQVFLLTHTLYFFYEMTDINHERRKKNQKLFRIMKNSQGSHISEMDYDEIQNDYQSYWSVIKDSNQPPALIANCMRNIIEYFFNFIEKRDLNNVFQKPELQATKYQAFCRYINRESHSLGQNIFDYKEFNYDDFKGALGLVFTESGYREHYERMIKI